MDAGAPRAESARSSTKSCARPARSTPRSRTPRCATTTSPATEAYERTPTGSAEPRRVTLGEQVRLQRPGVQDSALGRRPGGPKAQVD
jgi:hypothetical protein